MGKKCPYYLDPSGNDMTGRLIDDQPTIDYILKLHNEVRSKIARGRCDQPKAGCMWPLVRLAIYIFVSLCCAIKMLLLIPAMGPRISSSGSKMGRPMCRSGLQRR